MADPIDYSDPCVVLGILRPAYYQLLAGDREVETRIGDRMAKFSQSSITLLRDEVLRLEAACALKNGDAPKRFAIRLGSMR